jgi:PAS domain S-box-containing protein
MAMASNPYVPPEADVLYALQQLFLPLVTRAPDAVVVCNANGQIILVNPQVERWFGYTAQELHGQPLTMLVPERFRAAPLAQWAHSLATPRDQTAIVLPLAGRRKQGEEFQLDMSLSPLLLEHELFVVGILRDTVAHAQEDAASHRTELLVILGQLAATVSHEIRNPLQSLALHLEFLEEELQPSGAVAESFAMIKVELARLHSVVEDYLSLARVPNVRREAVAMDALLEAIAQEHQPRMAAQHVTLHLQGTQTLGQAALHRFTFRRAVLNLVANALDAMPEGGQLTLAGQRTASHLVVSVQDTGIGMPAEQLPLLFTPLYTTKTSGTGLGLYVVQEIVKAHGGTVDVTSTLGAGTTFTLRLPLMPADERITP